MPGSALAFYYNNDKKCPRCKSKLEYPYRNRKGLWVMRCSQYGSSKCKLFFTYRKREEASPSNGLCIHPSCSQTRKISRLCANSMCKHHCVTSPDDCPVKDHAKPQDSKARNQNANNARSAPTNGRQRGGGQRAPFSLQSSPRPGPRPLPLPPIIPQSDHMRETPPPSPVPSSPSLAPADQDYSAFTPFANSPAFGDVYSHLRSQLARGKTDGRTQPFPNQHQKVVEIMEQAKSVYDAGQGTPIHVVVWSEGSNIPLMLERSVTSHSYVLGDDHDVSRRCGVSQANPSVGFYMCGSWTLRSSVSPVPVEPGTWLFFRARAVGQTLGLVDLLALTNDPTWGVASRYIHPPPSLHSLASSSIVTFVPRSPYSRAGSAEPTSYVGPRPSSPTFSMASSPPHPREPSFASDRTYRAASSSRTPSPSKAGKGQRPHALQWPDGYTAAEVHEMMSKVFNIPKGPNLSDTSQVRQRFSLALGLDWASKPYHAALQLWTAFVVEAEDTRWKRSFSTEQPKKYFTPKQELEEFIQSGAMWTQFREVYGPLIKESEPRAAGKRKRGYMSDEDDRD